MRISDFSPEYQDAIEACVRHLNTNPHLISHEHESGDTLVIVYRGQTRFEVVIAKTIESGSVNFDESID